MYELGFIGKAKKVKAPKVIKSKAAKIAKAIVTDGMPTRSNSYTSIPFFPANTNNDTLPPSSNYMPSVAQNSGEKLSINRDGVNYKANVTTLDKTFSFITDLAKLKVGQSLDADNADLYETQANNVRASMTNGGDISDASADAGRTAGNAASGALGFVQRNPLVVGGGALAVYLYLSGRK